MMVQALCGDESFEYSWYFLCLVVEGFGIRLQAYLSFLFDVLDSVLSSGFTAKSIFKSFQVLVSLKFLSLFRTRFQNISNFFEDLKTL
jgi:hypothetical protein